MPQKRELSACESIAWNVAYSSNVAHSALRVARAEQSGVEAAEREFEMLSGMAGAVALMEDSPFKVSSPPEPLLPPGTGVTPADPARVEPPKKVRKKARQLADEILIYMLDNGPVTSEGRVRASSVLSGRVGIDGYDWGQARSNLGVRKLLLFDRDIISVNEEVVSELERQGRLSDGILEALHRRRSSSANEASTGDDEDCDGVGPEPSGAESLSETDGSAYPDDIQPQPGIGTEDAIDSEVNKDEQSQLDASGEDTTSRDGSSSDENSQTEGKEIDGEDDSGDIDESQPAAPLGDDLVEPATDEPEKETQEDELQEPESSRRSTQLKRPARRRKKKRTEQSQQQQAGKPFRFDFKSPDGRSFTRTLSSPNLRDLPPSIKLLLAIGQARAENFPFYKTEEQRFAFAVKVVNKSLLEEDHLDEGSVQTLLEEEITSGNLSRASDGVRLTSEGFDTLITAKLGRGMVGQVGLRETADSDGNPESPESNGRSGSRRRAVPRSKPPTGTLLG